MPLIDPEETFSLLDSPEESYLNEEEQRERDTGKLMRRKEVQKYIRGQETPQKFMQEEQVNKLINPGSVRESTGILNLREEKTGVLGQRESMFKNVLGVPPKPTIIPNEVEGITTGSKADLDVSVVDFLFGGEMSIIGMKYDNEGFHWDMEIAKQQWSEEPVWMNLLNTASLVGSMFFPAARAAWSIGKYGKGATLLNRAAGITRANELERFKALGLLDKSVKNVDDKTIKSLRKLEHAQSYYQDLATKMTKFTEGGEGLSQIDKLKMGFASRFANSYWKIGKAIIDGEEDVRKMFYSNLDDLFKAEDLGRYFVNVPDEGSGKAIYAYWLNKMRPGLIPADQIGKLSAADKAWADSLEIAMRAHQEEAVKLGMLHPNAINKIGELHIPALYKGTSKADLSSSRNYYLPLRRKATKKEIELGIAQKGDMVDVVRSFEMPRLDSPTLKPRGKELNEVAERMLNDELITDPTELTVRGFVTDRLLLNNYKTVSEIATNERFAISASSAINKYGSRKAAEKAGYVSLDTLQGKIPQTLRRMIEKKNPAFLDADGGLPMIKKSVFDDLFDESGLFAQAMMASNLAEILTVIHKTSKTALSIPTHFQNFGSNLAMLSQAGFNFLAPKNLEIGSKMAQTFMKISSAKAAAKAAGKSTDLSKLGVNFGKITIDGKTFNLADEFTDPKIMDLIEESAFEQVEGFANLERKIKALSSEQRLTKAVGEGALRAKKFLQGGDKKGLRWFDNATKMYLAEDMVPKMSYYMALRGKGLTKEAAILEVGRRLPMYNTVGTSIKRSRKVFLPWVTFPAEAVRITKNNMMDHPLRMLPWLQAPSIIQSMLTTAGFAPGADEVEAAKQQLPMWAQKHETVIAEQGAGGAIGGAATGALAGGVAGGFKGGARGGYLGAAAGAAVGALGAVTLSDSATSDRLRGAVLDWLPHSAFLLASTSPDFGGEVYPFKDVRGLHEQLPAEPLAIMKPFVDAFSGKTAWGEDLGGEDTGDQIGKAIAGLIGFMAPPLLQKYGYKTTSPDISLSQQITGGEGIPGDITNISRLLVDTGAATDPNTGKPANFTDEFFLKNFGIWKSWASDPANKLSNEIGTETALKQARSHLAKNLSFHLENMNDRESTRILAKVMQTYSRQYPDDPQKAQEKFREWVAERMDQIGRHPRLRQWSKEELLQRLKQTSDFAAVERGKAREEMMQFLNNQLSMRRAQKLIKEKQKELKELTSKKYSKKYTKKYDLGLGH